jgi:hypothetical protein
MPPNIMWISCRRAHAPERPLTPAAADAPPPSSTHVISDGEYDSLGAPLALSVGDNKHVVISDDSDCEAWSTPALLAMATPSATERADKRPRAPPATAVPRQPPQGPAGHNGALPASTGPRQMPQIHQGPASQTDKRPRATPLAVPSSCDAVLSTSPETLPSPSKRPRAGNRGEAMGADSPLLARPRSGSAAHDPQPKRHRGSVRCPPLRHGNATLDQDLGPVFAGGALLGLDMEPVFHDTPPRPCAGAGGALLGQDVEPLLHPRFAPTLAIGETPHLPVTSADDALLGQDLDQEPHITSPPPFAIGGTSQLPLAAAGRARPLAPPSGHGRACESNT